MDFFPFSPYRNKTTTNKTKPCKELDKYTDLKGRPDK